MEDQNQNDTIQLDQQVAPDHSTDLDNVLTAHVFRQKDNGNAKAPLYRVSVELPKPIEGITVEFPVFAARDNRGNVKGLDVSMPGGKFQAIAPLPVFVVAADGKRYPVSRSEDPRGSANLLRWQSQIVEACYRFEKTGESVQPIIFPKG